MEEEPRDVLVLTAIASEYTDERKIAKKIRLSLFEVTAIIERLIIHGFVERIEKKGLLGEKTILNVTEKGAQELRERKFELEQKWQKMVMVAKQGDKEQLKEMLSMNKSWIPVMMFMGIIDIVFWMSMLNMMGMSMQQAMPEGYDAGVGQEGHGDPDFDVNI